MKVLISACLLGINSRYDGKNKFDKDLLSFLIKNKIDFFPFCAEQLGGLTTPREPSETENGYSAQDVIEGRGRVLTKSGKDVTKNYIDGANVILKFCKSIDITHAILAEKSPSCGYTKVYDGTFTGTLIEGNGILTQILKNNGIVIVKDIQDLSRKSLTY